MRASPEQNGAVHVLWRADPSCGRAGISRAPRIALSQSSSKCRTMVDFPDRDDSGSDDGAQYSRQTKFSFLARTSGSPVPGGRTPGAVIGGCRRAGAGKNGPPRPTDALTARAPAPGCLRRGAAGPPSGHRAGQLTQLLAVCPRCGGRALVIPRPGFSDLKYYTEPLFQPRRPACGGCGAVADRSPEVRGTALVGVVLGGRNDRSSSGLCGCRLVASVRSCGLQRGARGRALPAQALTSPIPGCAMEAACRFQSISWLVDDSRRSAGRSPSSFSPGGTRLDLRERPLPVGPHEKSAAP
ncbi:hypothetical protein SGLAU_32075 [Streptomyces glaucescens]|uniref:Uncharacterized protein n=1 Tax=Streptomyces glaucescens TaxID=1907 RepID=A0A089XGC9_STRGA|nr:hypothetical protein SGLAU_32075 [Streptomyces glaucescens]